MRGSRPNRLKPVVMSLHLVWFNLLSGEVTLHRVPIREGAFWGHFGFTRKGKRLSYPLSTAISSGVAPSISRRVISAPFATSFLTSLVLPLLAALCKAVLLVSS